MRSTDRVYGTAATIDIYIK